MSDTALMVQGASGGGMIPAGEQAMQQVKTEYATAVSVQKPRTLAEVEHRLLDESAIAGTEFYYGWGAGKDRVEGASVHLAMAAVRLWGNAVVELRPVQEAHDAWIFTAAFIDLETGFTLARQFRQSKTWVVYGKFDEARKEDIRFQIGQSKAIRNVVLNAVPSWLTSRAMDRAKEGVRQELETWIGKKGIEEIRTLLLTRLDENGVNESRALSKFGRATPGGLTIEDMVVMRADVDALKRREDTPDSLYPRGTITVEPTANDGRSKADRLADQLGSTSATVETPGPTADDVGEEPQTSTDTVERIAEAIRDAETAEALTVADNLRKVAVRKGDITKDESLSLGDLIAEKRQAMDIRPEAGELFNDPADGSYYNQ